MLLMACMIQAQNSNLVVFTQEKEPFTLILNGIQQSPNPETNVKITGLNAPSYKMKVIFENKLLKEIDKTVYIQAEVEQTFEVLKNNKGIWVVRMLNTTPIDEVTSGQNDQQNVYIYTTSPRLSTTTVSQTTTVSTGLLPGGASITTMSTQTTSSSSSDMHNEFNGEHQDRNDYNDRDDHHERGDYNDYKGPRGCPRPMSKQSFDMALESINSKSFETSKLTIAKQIAGSNCLLCKQVKEIMKLFSFESNRLEFAKYAYKYTWDINNYFLLNDAFDFESSIDELNKYIQSRK
jgi:hypothetical protein